MSYFALRKELEKLGGTIFGDESFIQDIIIYINDNLKPEDVFDVEMLENWAETNDYTPNEEI